MLIYEGSNDSVYKITIMKSFFIEAPRDEEEYLIIERAVDMFNEDEIFHSIVPSDVVLV